jgi:hypothetical protein
MDTPNVHATLNALRFPTVRPKALAIARAFGRTKGRGRRAAPPKGGLLSSDASVPLRQEGAAPPKPATRAPASAPYCEWRGQ